MVSRIAGSGCRCRRDWAAPLCGTAGSGCCAKRFGFIGANFPTALIWLSFLAWAASRNWLWLEESLVGLAGKVAKRLAKDTGS